MTIVIGALDEALFGNPRFIGQKGWTYPRADRRLALQALSQKAVFESAEIVRLLEFEQVSVQANGNAASFT